MSIMESHGKAASIVTAMYTVQDAATRLMVSAALVYELVALGKLPCYRIGRGRGAIRISEEHIQSYLKSVEKKSRSARVTVQPLRNLSLD
jgi:excisionase family DNA binding protein